MFYYRPPTKLREGKVFTGVCLSTRWGGVSGPMSFPGVGGYLWYQVPSVGGGYFHGQGVGMSTGRGWSMSRGHLAPPRHGIQRDMVDKRAVRI